MEEEHGFEHMKKEKIQVYLDPSVVKDLKFLHQKEGAISYRTKKRKPFSNYINRLLSSHAHERMTCIRGMENFENMENDID